MSTLSDETARFIDALEVMRAAAYKSFSDRREYEWKLCMGLWTVFAIYTSALVIGPIETAKGLGVSGWPLVVGTLGVSALAFVAHYHWTVGISRANALNIRMADQISEQMREILGFEWGTRVREILEKLPKTQGSSRHWSHDVELAITLLLGIAATAAAYFRGNGVT